MTERSNQARSRSSWSSRDDPQQRINEWLQSWNDGTLGSLEDKEPDPLLVEHFERLSNGRQHLKILVPMCGICIDMKWLAERGHHVVGVDVSDVAASLFFSRHNIPHAVHGVPSIEGKLYKSTDGSLDFYVADFFRFNESFEGHFDVVWDTGALVSTDIKDRERYMSVMSRVMKATCVYLLEVLVYDKEKFKGPPHCFYQEDIKDIFGNEFNVDKIAEHKVDAPEQDENIVENFDEIGFRFHFYCLTRE